MSIKTNQVNRQAVIDFWTDLDNSTPQSAEEVAARHLSGEFSWNGFAPIPDLSGPGEYVTAFWRPFLQAFSDIQRETHLFIGGASNGKADGSEDGEYWAGGTGLFHARFSSDWLGIRAGDQKVSIRWGELCRVRDGRITKSHCLIDMVDFLQQLGIDVLPPARGKDGVWPPPKNDNAVFLGPQNKDESCESMDLIHAFIYGGLNQYDEDKLESMGIAKWFRPDIHWFGPGGIGACYGLKEFENLHQKHWLRAFPDRRVQDLECLVAEGSYSGAAGKHAVLATHSGEYLDTGATGNRLGVTGLDFWRREGKVFTENWVFVDMLDLFAQMGVDLMARARP